MPAWLVWLLGAAILAGAEFLSTALVLIMLAAGALAGSVTAAAGGPPVLQVAVAIAVGGVMLFGVRPVARRHLYPASAQRTNADALVGRRAVVLQVVDAHGGRVRLNGAEWSARSADEHQTIDVGKTVQVLEISGATAVVWDGP